MAPTELFEAARGEHSIWTIDSTRYQAIHFLPFHGKKINATWLEPGKSVNLFASKEREKQKHQ